MKNTVITFAAVCCSLMAISQNITQNDLGRVKKINGVEAYIMCEPLRDYNIVVDAGTGLKAESVVTGGLINKTIAGRVEQFIARSKMQDASIDAIVYQMGKHVVGVKFKDSATAENKGIGRASKMKGKYVFVMCEPLNTYDILKTKGGGIKWKSAVTAGLINNSIEEDVEKIVNKLDGVKGCDAFYFEGKKEGEAISFAK